MMPYKVICKVPPKGLPREEELSVNPLLCYSEIVTTEPIYGQSALNWSGSELFSGFKPARSIDRHNQDSYWVVVRSVGHTNHIAQGFEAWGSLAVAPLACGSCLSSVAVVIRAQAGPLTKQLIDFLGWCRDQKCPEAFLDSYHPVLYAGLRICRPDLVSVAYPLGWTNLNLVVHFTAQAKDESWGPRRVSAAIVTNQHSLAFGE
ncbi:hypothetical protein T265_07535 [Opisthorchis viverrini]|uniref:Uncharacterized protein n=1 Tax=Opisthorchis viverrini TaxID=6198 RepID=A0A074ZC73_OPIVI|nr:hypothetical protein T265_07535 [Opisthorchis viverrini]KER24911.1 hypothetical protein T265_07535 [Opisthorchis viverrini]